MISTHVLDRLGRGLASLLDRGPVPGVEGRRDVLARCCGEHATEAWNEGDEVLIMVW